MKNNHGKRKIMRLKAWQMKIKTVIFHLPKWQRKKILKFME